MKAFALLFCLLFGLAAHAKRTVFVQLFEWPWEDVARECELRLGPEGFAAVQVSPPTEHLEVNGDWWERYQPVSYKLDSRSGNEAQFRDMVQRCHDAGVDVYADVVLNHMDGLVDQGVGFAGTPFTHYNYPGLYNYNDFHHCGRNGNDDIVHFDDLYELWNCELLNLADLNTGSPHVQATEAGFLNHLLEIGVAGLRLDAAKHMDPKDIDGILSRLNRSAYIFQELIVDSEPLPVDQYLALGDVTVFPYSYDVGRAFNNHRLGDVTKMATNPVYPNSEQAVVFLENHDLQRDDPASGLLSYRRNPALTRLAYVFMLAWPYGYPRVFSSYDFQNFDDGPPQFANHMTKPVLDPDGNCQAPWLCEHRDPDVVAMVKFRNNSDPDFAVSNFWTNGADQIAFGRGAYGFVAINIGLSPLQQSFQTSLAPGDYPDLLHPGASYRVDGRGKVNLSVPAMSAIALQK